MSGSLEENTSRANSTLPAEIRRQSDSKLAQFLSSIFGKRYGSLWPGSQDGLLFQWRDNKDNGQFVNGSGESRNVHLRAQGRCPIRPKRRDAHPGGAFAPEGSFNKEIRDACKKTGEIAIEAIVTTSRVPQFGPARIISLSRSTSKRNFTLGQQDGYLVFRLQTSNTNRNGMDFKLAPLEEGTPCHVLVTLQAGAPYVLPQRKDRESDQSGERLFRRLAGQQLFADLRK